MQFLNECVSGLSVGVLAEFDANGKIAQRSSGRIIGLVTKVFQTQKQVDADTVVTIDVAEITTHGATPHAVLSGAASWKGCDLYATSDGKLSATVNGDVIAMLIPRTLGEGQTDFADGNTVTVVML